VTPDRRSARSAAPVSPCINVCVLDERDVCQGCQRTIDEIAGWGRMSAAEQWAVMDRLARLGGDSGRGFRRDRYGGRK
jgi:predicted Fe-S protein YdhL (DUF1289 family)